MMLCDHHSKAIWRYDDDDDDVFIFTCAPVLGHMTHGEIYLQEGVDIG